MRLRTINHQLRRLRQVQQPGCQAIGQPVSHQQIMAIKPLRFGAVQGNAFVTFNCTAATAKLRVTDKCYEDVQVYQRHESKELFVDISSC